MDERISIYTHQLQNGNTSLAIRKSGKYKIVLKQQEKRKVAFQASKYFEGIVIPSGEKLTTLKFIMGKQVHLCFFKIILYMHCHTLF